VRPNALWSRNSRMQALHGGDISKPTKGTGFRPLLRRAYGTVLFRSFGTLGELREDSDEKLFFLSRYNPTHILQRLLPQPKNIGYNLRQRTHNLTLPADGNTVIKQNIVYKMLFRGISYLCFYVLLLFCTHCLLLFICLLI